MNRKSAKITQKSTEPQLCERSNQTAAEFLAYAALDLFPDARLLGGRGTSRYFYYDFEFSFPHDKLTLSLIEERMARLLKSETVKKEKCSPLMHLNSFSRANSQLSPNALPTSMGM